MENLTGSLQEVEYTVSKMLSYSMKGFAECSLTTPPCFTHLWPSQHGYSLLQLISKQHTFVAAWGSTLCCKIQPYSQWLSWLLTFTVTPGGGLTSHVSATSQTSVQGLQLERQWWQAYGLEVFLSLHLMLVHWCHHSQPAGWLTTDVLVTLQLPGSNLKRALL